MRVVCRCLPGQVSLAVRLAVNVLAVVRLAEAVL